MKNIFNFYQLADNLSTAGQPKVNEFGKIAQNGYELIMNLAANDYDNVIPNEGEIIQELGLPYISIPIVLKNPRVEQYYLFGI
jgi:protein tyrosine phosphatase (PTP) superfamily phosphohydrolase (DUF442 family)